MLTCSVIISYILLYQPVVGLLVDFE